MLRLTEQRQAILQALRGVKTHPTADQVYDAVRERLPNISLGTVYRNLEILAENGLVARVNVGGRQMRFDGDTSRHYHVRCTTCGRVGDVSSGEFRELNEEAQRHTDYVVTGHRVEFVGVCPTCANARSGGKGGRACKRH
jgi:Fur family ferric uptake transcriptional regulator